MTREKGEERSLTDELDQIASQSLTLGPSGKDVYFGDDPEVSQQSLTLESPPGSPTKSFH